MGIENQSGEAAPAATGLNSPAGGDFSPDLMQGVFSRFGKKLPTATPLAAAASAEQREDGHAEPERAAPAEAGGAEPEREEQADAGGEPTAEERARAEKGAQGDDDDEPEKPGAEAQDEAEAEGDEPAAEAEASEAEETGEHDGDTEKLVQRKLKELPADTRKLVQSVINERVGEISRKSRVENDRLANRLVEVTGELDTIRRSGGVTVTVPDVHPAALADTPQQIDQHEADTEKLIDFLDAHRETGIEADPDKGIPGFTPEQVREQLREARKTREKVIPYARQVLVNRGSVDAAVRQILPDMFDPRAELYAQAERIRRQMPEFRRFADCNALIAQFLLGAKSWQQAVQTHQSRQGQPAQGQKTKAVVRPVVKTARRAPRAPGDGSMARGSPLDDPRLQRTDPSDAIKKVAKTRDRRDLVAAVRGLRLV